MDAVLSPSSTLAQGAGALICGVVVAGAALAAAFGGQIGCPDPQATAPASATAARTIPASYLILYRQAGAAYRVPWTVLAAIGAIESDHGRSRAPGVRAGVNAYGCCAGPMQFNLRDGPPSTWQTYRVDGDRDGTTDPYDPADAIPSAAQYLSALLERAHGDVRAAVYGYNHSSTYVAEVLERARRYRRGGEPIVDSPGEAAAGSCSSAPADTGATDFSAAVQRRSPRAYASLPGWAMAGGRAPELIDARLLADAVTLLRTYHLRVTAAREAGHHTHGDGTALDLIPAEPTDQAAWDTSAGALAHDLGWTPGCAASGVRPVCALVPAIQFVGYDGYPGHGSPRTCSGGCAAHLHVSWVSPCYGTSAPSDPCPWVKTFTARRRSQSRQR